MKQYYVYGGVYEDAGKFTKLVHGTNEEYGPYSSYQEAHQKWASRAWSTVDDCHARFQILEK